MKVTLTVLYRQPEDEVGFMAHYEAVHIPLVRSMPGLSTFRHGRVMRNLSPGADYFLMAEMVYPEMAVFKDAMRSPENEAVRQDLANLAAEAVMFLVEHPD